MGTTTRGRPQLKTIRTRNSNGNSNSNYSDEGVKSHASFGAESVHGVGVNASCLTTWCEQVRAGYNLDGIEEEEHDGEGDYDNYGGDGDDDYGAAEEAAEPVQHTGYTDDGDEDAGDTDSF